MAVAARKRVKIDWGGLLDEAWGEESEEECKTRLTGENHPKSLATVAGTEGVASAKAQNVSRAVPLVSGEGEDLEPSFRLSDFSPSLFSRTSTPRKSDSPESDAASVDVRTDSSTGDTVPIGLKARRPAFTSHRPGTFIGNCAVVVTKCSLPTRYRDHLYNTKYFRPVHQHNCVNRHFSKFKGRDSNEAKTWLKESMTAKLILTSASSGKRNVRSGLKPGMSLAKVPSCSERVCSSPRSVSSLPSYSSPLLSPGSTTTPLSILSPPHTPHNRDRAAAGLNDLSTTAASSDTHAPLTSSPAAVVNERCSDDEKFQVPCNSPSVNDFNSENPLMLTPCIRKHNEAVNCCGEQITRAILCDKANSKSETNIGAPKMSPKTEDASTSGVRSPLQFSSGTTLPDSQISSSCLYPSLSLQPITPSSSLTTSANINTTQSTPLSTLASCSNQSTPISTCTARNSPVMTCNSNQSLTSTDHYTILSSTVPTFTNNTPLNTPTSSSNHSTPSTVSSSYQTNHLATPTTTVCGKLPLLEISLNSIQSTSRDSTPSMQPGIGTGKMAHGRRLVLVPYTPKCRRESSTPSSVSQSGRVFQSGRGRERGRGRGREGGRKMRNSENRQRRADNRGSTQKTEQLYLDFGQQSLGHTTCSVCGMVYTRGLDDDVTEHSKFHRRFLAGITFRGWKNERVVSHYFDGRIVMVLPSDPRQHLKKVQDLCSVMDTELGYAEGVKPWHSDAKIFLYVSVEKKVMGCVVAEKIEQGYRVMSTSPGTPNLLDDSSAWYCSSVPEVAQVGMNRVWVSQQYRRR